MMVHVSFFCLASLVPSTLLRRFDAAGVNEHLQRAAVDAFTRFQRCGTFCVATLARE
jgi:hypothetical protein